MKLADAQLNRLSPLLLSLLLLVSLPATHGAGLPPRPGYESSVSVFRSTQRRLFPWLKKARDSAIEVIFWRHPAKLSQLPAVSDLPPTDYADQIVLRFATSDAHEQAALSEAIDRLFLDEWATTQNFIDVRLHAKEVAPLLGLLPDSLRTSYSTLIPDLNRAVYHSSANDAGQRIEELGTPYLRSPVSAAQGDIFQEYRPLPVIIRWMRLLEAMFPSLVELLSIGESFEGREILALRVGVPSVSDPAKPRKTILVTGGLHAREWISTSTVNYLAWSLVTSFGKEQLISKLLEQYDVVFLPTINPDGFEYTWNVDRLWRKSRQPIKTRFCPGIDLDHAFGFVWEGPHARGDPCSGSYSREGPFKATEALRLAAWARNQTLNNVRFVGLLDLHSYSQQVLWPYAFSCWANPVNLENLEEVATDMAKAIRLSNGKPYSAASACGSAALQNEAQGGSLRPQLETGGGSAIDWFRHQMHTHLSFQIKLRDTGSYGFLLPKEHIVPVGEEIFEALKSFADFLLGHNGIEQAPVTTDTTYSAHSAGNGSDSDSDRSTTSFSHELRRRRVRGQ